MPRPAPDRSARSPASIHPTSRRSIRSSRSTPRSRSSAWPWTRCCCTWRTRASCTSRTRVCEERSVSGGVVIQGHFPIPEERRDQLQQLATELNREQLMWLSGYFAGAAAAAPSSIPGFQSNLLGGGQARAQIQPAAAPASVAPAAVAPAAAAAPTLTIISASHTGNGRKISEKLLAAVQALGVQARMVKAGDYQPREIAKEKLLYVVISTHGDGDPPDEARGLYEFLGTKRAPQLPELQYSVLALGDSSYPKFCEAGRIVDE